MNHSTEPFNRSTLLILPDWPQRSGNQGDAAEDHDEDWETRWDTNPIRTRPETVYAVSGFDPYRHRTGVVPRRVDD